MFLYAVMINMQVIMMIELLIWFVFIVSMGVEYGRRRTYYQELERTLEELDQKYLLTEVLHEPLFMDGKILYETMRIVDKSMAEHTNRYRLAQSEYKDYIELWVHEVKTPLAAAKLVLENNTSNVSESVLEELDKIESFVEQALFYARSTNPEKDYMIEELSLKECVNKVVRKHSKTFIYKKIKLEIECVEEQVYSDSKWLTFILNQIINNALKYMPLEDGVLHIYGTKQEHCILLHIQDNGIGIPEYEHSRIFDKGFTGTNGRGNEKATGMGLYLCKLLCDKLYLALQCESIEHVGTTITITFPISSMMLLK